MSSKVVISRVINLIFGLAVIIVNFYASIVPLNGTRVGQGGGQPGALQPYGTAFAIWGLIYLFLLFFLIYQLFPSTYELEYINRGITPVFFLHAIFNIVWIFTQAYLVNDLYWIQLMVIYFLFLSLLTMYTLTTKFIRRDLAEGIQSDHRYIINFIFGRFWLSVYMAWITGAICVDSFSVLADNNAIDYINSSIVLAAIGLVALIILVVNRDVLFGLTVVWSSCWISYYYSYVLNQGNAIEWPTFISGIVVACVVFLASVVVFILNMIFVVRRFSAKRKSPEDDTTQIFAERIA